MLLDIFNVIAPIFVLAGIGFIWSKRGKPFPVEAVSLLVTQIGTPCLVLSALLKADVDSGMLAQLALLSSLALLSFAAVGWLALRMLKLPVRDFLPALTFPNNGNAGLSLCMFAYGAPGLAMGLVFFTICSVANFSFGQAIAAGRLSGRELLRIPVVYAVVLAALGKYFAFVPPAWVMRSLDTAGGIAIPLMLLMLGVSLASLKVSDLAVAAKLTVLRLGLGVAVGLGLVWLFDLEGVARGTMLIQCAMPVAVINFVFAARHGRDAPAVAGLVVVSTLLSFATLPLLMYLVLGE
ncbi:AEC family transporter [Ferrovibrio sp.]|uniref:AEC family transporter n=1 Tax=Ferrovibrio sp. TaxID=1917215 RepID=UPI0025BA3711|nr:AEC family transporter [Ferrovibrio sp.]MBX3455618.1 AEC family transporter [Ferrovibrio sp.]